MVKKVVDVMFGSRNKQTNEQLLSQNELAEMRNVWMDDTGSVEVRKGVDVLDSSQTHGSLILRGNEVVGLPQGREEARKHETNASRWSDVEGKYRTARMESRSLMGLDGHVTGPGEAADGTPNGNYIGIAARTITASNVDGLLIRVYDTETGSLHYEETYDPLGTGNPVIEHIQVVAMSNTEIRFLFSNEQSDIWQVIVSGIGTSPTSTDDQIVSALSTTADKKRFVAHKVPGSSTNYYVLYTDTSDDLVLRRINDLVTAYSFSWTPPSTTAPTNPIEVFAHSNSDRVWCFYNAQNLWHCRTVQDTGAAFSTTVENPFAGNALALGQTVPPAQRGNIVCFGRVLGAIRIFFDVDGGNYTRDHVVRSVTVSEGAIFTTDADEFIDCAIYAGSGATPDVPNDGDNHFMYLTSVSDGSADIRPNGSLFLVEPAVDEGYNLGERFYPLRFVAHPFVEEHAGGWRTNGTKLNTWGSTQAIATLASVMRNTPVDYEDNVPEVNLEVVTVRANETSSVMKPPRFVEVNGTTYFSNGAMPMLYDGTNVRPANILKRPRRPEIAGTSSGGSLTANATYSVIIVHYLRDAQGNEYFSAPSPPATVTLGGSDNNIEVSLRMNPEAAFSEPVTTLIFRTLEDSTNYHLAENRQPESAGVFTSIVLEDADAIVATKTPLYTIGGEQENSLPEGLHVLVSDGEHVYGVPAADRQIITVSKPVRSAVGVEFSLFRRFRIGAGGDINGLGLIDGRVIVFKKNQIRYLVGSPPDLVGRGGFTGSRLVSSEYGAEEPQSVVSLGDEILFRSSKGWHLLDRSMNVKYIGQGIKDLEDQEVARAVVDRQEERVRVVLAGGEQMVWDRLHRQWSVWEYDGDAADLFDGVSTEEDWYCLAEGNSQVYSEAAAATAGTQYADEGTPVVGRVKTGPLRLGSILGWGRVHLMALLGKFIAGTTSITWQTFLSYGPSAQETVLSTTTTVLGATANDPVLVRVNPSDQECVTMQQQIDWSDETGASQPAKLTGYAAEVSAESGLARLEPTETF